MPQTKTGFRAYSTVLALHQTPIGMVEPRARTAAPTPLRPGPQAGSRGVHLDDAVYRQPLDDLQRRFAGLLPFSTSIYKSIDASNKPCIPFTQLSALTSSLCPQQLRQRWYGLLVYLCSSPG